MKLLKEIRKVIEKNRLYDKFFSENKEIYQNFIYWIDSKKTSKKKPSISDK